jgi:hypothetical protein
MPAADADGVPTVSIEAANKKGNTTFKNFDLVNTVRSPTLYKQESRLAQLVTLKGHPERYLRSFVYRVETELIGPNLMDYWGGCAARLRRSRIAIARPSPTGC